jgi:hypothetical protein
MGSRRGIQHRPRVRASRGCPAARISVGARGAPDPGRAVSSTGRRGRGYAPRTHPITADAALPPRSRPAREFLARIRARPLVLGGLLEGVPSSAPSMTSLPDVAQRDDRGTEGRPRGRRARSSKISGARGPCRA